MTVLRLLALAAVAVLAAWSLTLTFQRAPSPRQVLRAARLNVASQALLVFVVVAGR